VTRLSFPKERVRILLLEGIHENAVADLAANGFVDIDTRSGALGEEELA
jgi:D-3-phosphoglycerate dehydrogenase